MGGDHFRSDEAFVDSAVGEVDRLAELVGLDERSSLLDWGCGAGRLAIGVAERMSRIEAYVGLDVQHHLIDWAARHLGRREGFQFAWVDVVNARYNSGGAKQAVIPASESSFDIVYAYSVFSHMQSADSYAYLNEFSRVLKPDGRAFFTAFVEEDVPDEIVNPHGYGPIQWSGPLHCVRYSREYFERILVKANLEVELRQHGQETDGQSLYVVRTAKELHG